MSNIDIAHIIKNSDSKFLKSLPDFIVKIIAKFIRQDEINQILDKYKDFEGVDFLPKIIGELDIEVEVEGMENMPNDGRCFFVANHPYGLLDGLILTYVVSNIYGELKAIGNDAFMFIPNLKPIIANVSVFGENPKKYFTELEKVFASDVPITHFPFGLVSRVHKFKVQDNVWKKSFIKKAVSNKRDIVPITFYGRNSNLFYAIYLFRKIFRIKTNLELVLLPRELFRKRGKTINIRVNEPISYKRFSNMLTPLKWAQWVRLIVYS